ncbi:MAG TPA: RimK family alpha-L-glutamate ligase [Dongiaceae bacterium]|nr:RimK family alpha-L-glutamate ligase [Dongiaceae bacterium]
MRLGVISRKATYWGTKRIIRAARNRGLDTQHLKTDEIQLMVDESKAAAAYHDVQLSEFDMFIPRIGRSLTEFGVLLLNHLDIIGIPTTLSRRGLFLARNKFLALQELKRAKVKIPSSILLGSRFEMSDLVGQMPTPFIMKLLSGTQGVGVMRVDDPKDARPIVDTLVELKQLICVQKYVPNPGEDIRAFVVGQKVVAAMRRIAPPNEWRSNIHLGGKGVGYKLTKEQEDTALRAARALDVEIAGVDMIQSTDGTYVIEVNVSPGFRGLYEATGIDASEAIAEHVIQRMKG